MKGLGDNFDSTRRKLLTANAIGMMGVAANSFSPFTGANVMAETTIPELVLINGKITTLDQNKPQATAVAIANGRILKTGSDKELMSLSGEDRVKGAIRPGEYTDLAVLSADIMTVDEEQIKDINSSMTIMDGRIVYASDEFANHNPALPPVMPDWSPVNEFGGYYQMNHTGNIAQSCGCSNACSLHDHDQGIAWNSPLPVPDKSKRAFWGALGCSCFALA